MKTTALFWLFTAAPLSVVAQLPSPSATQRAPALPRTAATITPTINQTRASSTPKTDSTTDLVTVSGRLYKHARVGSVDPDGITYFFDGGVAKIPFTDLPDAIRKQYGYDPKQASAFAAQDEVLQQRLADNAAAAEKSKGEAVAAKSQAEALLKKEQERLKQMQAQIGSSIVDDQSFAH